MANVFVFFSTKKKIVSKCVIILYDAAIAPVQGIHSVLCSRPSLDSSNEYGWGAKKPISNLFTSWEVFSNHSIWNYKIHTTSNLGLQKGRSTFK